MCLSKSRKNCGKSINKLVTSIFFLYSKYFQESAAATGKLFTKDSCDYIVGQGEIFHRAFYPFKDT